MQSCLQCKQSLENEAVAVSAHLVGKSLSVEVNRVHVHFVAHSQQIPVHLLALRHLQASQVTIQPAIDSFNKHSHSVRWLYRPHPESRTDQYNVTGKPSVLGQKETQSIKHW